MKKGPLGRRTQGRIRVFLMVEVLEQKNKEKITVKYYSGIV